MYDYLLVSKGNNELSKFACQDDSNFNKIHNFGFNRKEIIMDDFCTKIASRDPTSGQVMTEEIELNSSIKLLIPLHFYISTFSSDTLYFKRSFFTF